MTSPQKTSPPALRLDSWKEIASFFDRDERTVTRWEKELGMPVHRLPGKVKGRVYAYTRELLIWQEQQGTSAASSSPASDGSGVSSFDPPAPARDSALPDKDSAAPGSSPSVPIATKSLSWVWVAAILLLLCGAAVLATARGNFFPRRGLHHAPNAAAQNLYLQGRFQWDRRTPESLARAVDLFTQAIVHDPQYANAYAGLADTYLLLREFSTMPEGDAYGRALAAAQKAVELDPSSAEAHCALGFIDFYWKTDVPSANREFARAAQLDPNRAQTFQWYANVLTLQGRTTQAFAAADHARELAPSSRAILVDRLAVLFEAGHDADVRDLAAQLVQSDPRDAAPHSYLAGLALVHHDLPAFASEMRATGTLAQDPVRAALADATQRGLAVSPARAASELLREATALRSQGRLKSLELSSLQAELGAPDDAMRSLQSLAAHHDPRIIYMRTRGLYEPLSKRSDYQDLLRQVGLAEAQTQTATK